VWIRTLDRARLDASENEQGGEGRCLLIGGPWRPERSTKGRNLSPQLTCPTGENCLDAIIEFPFSNPGDLDVQPFAGFPEGLPEELTLGRMDQRV
jgi:hypothetical protein